MVVAVNSIFENNFEVTQTQDKNLSLLIGPDRLSYLILTNDFEEVLGLGSYSFSSKGLPINLLKHLDEVFDKDDVLKLPFANTFVSLYTRRFTMVPDALYREEAKQDYFENVLALSERDELLVDELKDVNSHLVYSVSKNLMNWLKDKLPGAEPHCTASAVIAGAERCYSDQDHMVFALIQERSLSITVYHKNRLILHQVFGFTTPEDCLYYILLAYKQLGLSRDRQKLYLSGELVKDSAIYDLLVRYIRHVLFVDRPSILICGEKVGQLPAHFYFDLFSTKLCVSSAVS